MGCFVCFWGAPFRVGNGIGMRLRWDLADVWCRVEAALEETGRETVHDDQSISGREVLEDLRAKAE